MNPQIVVQVVQPHWYEYITIAALFLGPIFALLASRRLDHLREKERNQKQLFFTLMGTRADFTHVDHVRALNSIDAVFSDKSGDDKNIRDLWKKVLDHVATEETGQPWRDTLDTLRVDVYQAIGNKLGYRYTTDYIKRGVYLPMRHNTIAQNQATVLDGFAKAVKDGTLKVRVEPEPPPPQPIPRMLPYGKIAQPDLEKS
jgi:hypothetical protein